MSTLPPPYPFVQSLVQTIELNGRRRHGRVVRLDCGHELGFDVIDDKIVGGDFDGSRWLLFHGNIDLVKKS